MVADEVWILGWDRRMKVLVSRTPYSGCSRFVKTGVYLGWWVGKAWRFQGIDMTEGVESLLEGKGGVRGCVWRVLLAAYLDRKEKNICCMRSCNLILIFASLRSRDKEV